MAGPTPGSQQSGKAQLIDDVLALQDYMVQRWRRVARAELPIDSISRVDLDALDLSEIESVFTTLLVLLARLSELDIAVEPRCQPRHNEVTDNPLDFAADVKISENQRDASASAKGMHRASGVKIRADGYVIWRLFDA